MTDSQFAVIVREALGQQCLCANVAFAAGEPMIAFGVSARHAAPARWTLQVALDEHIEPTPEFLRYVNHSCEPNAFFDVERRALVALRPLAPGDEVTSFYPSTEWTMGEPFDCQCGSSRCSGRISGAALMPRAALVGRRLAPHVALQLAKSVAS